MKFNAFEQLCVESVHGIEAALAGGADRIELCSALALGGLTPSVGLMEQAVAMARSPAYAQHRQPGQTMAVMAMVRPRLGDFVYGERELAAMRGDIRAARAAGVDGVVLGVSHPSGQVDEALLVLLVREAKGHERVRFSCGDDHVACWIIIIPILTGPPLSYIHIHPQPLSVTLHRAIDLSPDPVTAVDVAIRAGVDRILTSGGGRGAMEGATVIAQMVRVCMYVRTD